MIIEGGESAARPTGSSHIKGQMNVAEQDLLFFGSLCLICSKTPVGHKYITVQTPMVARMFPDPQLTIN